MPEDWSQARNILLVRLDNIGDLVMLTPAIRALRRQLPRARLTLLASPAGSRLAPLLDVDAVFMHRPVWQEISASRLFEPQRDHEDLVARLRNERFDSTFIFTSFSQSPYPPAYVAYLAGIPRLVGQSREFGGQVLSHWVQPPPDDAHQVDRNLHLLASVGIEPAGTEMEVYIGPALEERAARLLAGVGLRPEQEFIAVVPGASCDARRYDFERWRGVTLGLPEATGLPVVVLGNQREMALAALADGSRARSLVGRTTVPEFAAVLARAAAVVCGNSSALHFADAFRRPVVVLYSGTDLESQWRPRHAPAAVLRRPTDCSPCYRFDCPYDKQCLDIPASEVLQAVAALIEREREPEPIETGGLVG